MKNEDKPIRLTGHTLYQLRRRGTTEIEITEAIRNESWTPAELGRLDAEKTLPMTDYGTESTMERNRSVLSL